MAVAAAVVAVAVAEDDHLEAPAPAEALVERRRRPTLVVLHALAPDLHAHLVVVDTMEVEQQCLTVQAVGHPRA